MRERRDRRDRRSLDYDRDIEYRDIRRSDSDYDRSRDVDGGMSCASRRGSPGYEREKEEDTNDKRIDTKRGKYLKKY